MKFNKRKMVLGSEFPTMVCENKPHCGFEFMLFTIHPGKIEEDGTERDIKLSPARSTHIYCPFCGVKGSE